MNRSLDMRDAIGWIGAGFLCGLLILMAAAVAIGVAIGFSLGRSALRLGRMWRDFQRPRIDARKLEVEVLKGTEILKFERREGAR